MLQNELLALTTMSTFWATLLKYRNAVFPQYQISRDAIMTENT